jgi:hypothetical protein
MTMHGRHPACFALLVLGGCLTFPTPVAAQQFPAYPNPPAQTNWGQPGGLTDWFWRRDMRQPAPRQIVRPEVANAAGAAAEPVAKPQPRLAKPPRNPARGTIAQPARLKSAASWKRMKNDATVRNLRNCLVAYAAREADRDKEASLSTLLIRATEESCRKEVDALIRTLATRSESAAIEPVMRELVQGLFVPAAKSAVSNRAPPAASAATVSLDP